MVRSGNQTARVRVNAHARQTSMAPSSAGVYRQGPAQSTRPMALQVQVRVPIPPPAIVHVASQVKPALHVAPAMQAAVPASAAVTVQAAGQFTRPRALQVQAR